MTKKLVLTQEVEQALFSLRQLAVEKIAQQAIDPIWEKITKAVVDEKEPEVEVLK